MNDAKKEKMKEYRRKYRLANLEKLRAYDAAFKRKQRAENTPSAQAARARKRSAKYRAKTNAARATPKQRENQRRYATKYRSNPESKSKELARGMLNRAVVSGAVVRPDTCERCGKTPPRGRDGRSLIRADHWHGYDAAHALDVQWICTTCDGEVERERAASSGRS